MAFCGDFFQEVGLHVCENVVHGACAAVFPGIEKQK